MTNISCESTTYFTHGFHPYPAKYTPQLVNKYFHTYCKEGYKTLDPFCGSGTTIVEGVLNGMDSVGIDLNPIAYIVSKAKTNKYLTEDISLISHFISELKLEIGKNGFFEDIEHVEIPDFPNRSHWFQDNICYELAYLKTKIQAIKNLNVKDLLICAFSKIIVKVSNQDSEIRYVAKNKNHPNGTVFTAFITTVLNYLEVLRSNSYSINAKAQIFNGDTNIILKQIEDNSFNFIITSPPYINTFDYYLYHKLRMFWLDYDHRPIRRQEIGNHHRIDTKSFEVAKAEYIQSMTEIMNELARVSTPESYFVMVIGDGIIDGITIDMSQVIADICKNCNYEITQNESTNLSDTTRSFNKKFSRASKKEHYIILQNHKSA